MLFNSWEFLVLVLVVVLLYYGPRSGGRPWQVAVLLTGSAVFYAWEEPKLLVLLLGSCLLNSLGVERVLHWKAEEKSSAGATTGATGENGSARARWWLGVTVAGNLALLLFFKYAGFLSSFLPDSQSTQALKHWASDIPLPIGISFYTFQGISMVVDAWRGDLDRSAEDKISVRGAGRLGGIANSSFYLSFFPQLVAGPIVKARDFVGQIGTKQFADIDWQTVRRALVTGYFLKVFVADNLAEQTGTLTLGAEHLANNGPFNLLPLLYGYSLQIFADFAGYSLIAIGLGALFGYRLPENFRFPYLSTSVTEFWRRWHLSLSSWLRDYLYIPLGGNREGVGRTYFNLFVVMFLGGLWHGASWKFAIWGILHGGFLAAERFLSRRRGKVSEIQTLGSGSGCAAPKRRGRFIYRSLLGWCFTFHVVTLLWLTFLMPDMKSVFSFFKGVFSGNTFLQGPPIFALMVYGSAVVAYHAWGWLHEHRGGWASRLQSSVAEPLVHGVMIFLMVSNPGAPKGFIYFQF